MRSTPVLAPLGSRTLPSTAPPRGARLLQLDARFQELAFVEGAQVFKASDWRCVRIVPLHPLSGGGACLKTPPKQRHWLRGRPFMWRGEVYLGHWVAYAPAQERMAVSRLHMQSGRVSLVHRFSTVSAEIEAALTLSAADKAGCLLRGRSSTMPRPFRHVSSASSW